MTVELFKNIPEYKKDITYDIKYLDYFIKNIIYKCSNQKCTLEYIVDFLEKQYGDTIKKSILRKYLNDSFIKNGVNNFVISDNEKKLINFIIILKDKICKLQNVSEGFLYSELYKYLLEEDSKLSDIYLYIAALEIFSNRMNLEEVLFKIYNLLEEKFIYVDKYNERYKIIGSIKQIYDKFDINYIVKDEVCLKLLSMTNISSIMQLKLTNNNLLDLVFVFNDDFYKICQSLAKSLYELTLELAEEYDFLFDDRESDILKLRYGYKTGKNMTLEEVGAIYSLTRERVRQIEARCAKKIKGVAEKNRFVLNLIFDTVSKNKKMIYINDIKKIIDKEKVSFMDCVLSNEDNLYFKTSILYMFGFEGKCKFNCEYMCLYDSRFKFEELLSEKLLEMPIYFSKIQIRELFGLDKVIFDKNYKQYHNIFIRKNMLPRDVFVYVIKQNFPNGFKTSDEKDYNKFKNIILNEVGEIDEFPAMRSLRAMIERDSTMIMCDRGTYIDIKNINDLPEELYEEIISYIYESKPVVYYNSIFEKFKYGLEEYNIRNHYLLKGLIDRRLPTDFYSRRDYISVGDKTVCPYDKILEIIHSYDGVFSLNDLRKEFNGVADYVFFNILYPEKEKGLIFLENKKFIYFNKLNITMEDKIKIKGIMDSMFVSLNSDTISVRKVYARIKLFEEEYGLHLDMINSYFDMFSIIQVLFPNEYYYSRPFISTNPNVSKSRDELLRNHLLCYDMFTNKDIKVYLTKMNIHGIYSYLNFMENMSDQFVQIDMDKMVKKEKLCITDDDLRGIKKIINLLISNFKCIDTRIFNGYSMFPKIKYEWNKYLLVGIVRSYFSDVFTIDNTDNTYNTTDFIIRSDVNE